MGCKGEEGPVGLLTDLVKRCDEWRRTDLHGKEEWSVRGTTRNDVEGSKEGREVVISGWIETH